MKNNLRTQLNAALRDVDWHGEEQVLQKIRQRRKPVRPVRLSRALIFAIVLMIMLATTAVALTLYFSKGMNDQLRARQTVQRQYGLTDEMIDLFTYEAADGEDGTAARFTMNLMHGDKLGEYTVNRLPDGSLSAQWSHDEADQELLLSGSLASPAWGAKQLERILPLYRETMTNWQSALNYGELTLEERAALDAPMLEAQETGALICIAPDAADLSVDAAERIAREAVTDKYGVSEEELDACRAAVSFYLYGGEERREYRFDWHGLSGNWTVYVASPSGAVTQCSWTGLAKDRTLPEGDLGRYPLAAREFVTCGAFDLLSAREKAAVTQRYAAAGLGDLLPRGDFVAPSAGEITEAEARALAEAALAEAYGLPAGWKSLFLSRASMVSHDDRREWIMEYLPHELANGHWREFDRLGVYTATVDAAAGAVVSHDWSLKDVPLDGYTESTFAACPAYSGAMLPWLQSLLARAQAILDRYPQHINLDEMSLEDRGAYDALMRGAGYSAVQYQNLIPDENDMPQDEAAARAWDALNAVYDLSGLSLVRGDPCQEGLYMAKAADGGWLRVWNIVYTNNMDVFTVRINSETGEVEGLWHDSPAFSNG